MEIREGLKSCQAAIVLASLLLVPHVSFAASGTEGASFLDIPVGAQPASLGSAYSALADDAYAPVYNPAGLGYLESTQIAGMHLAYLESIKYEYLSVVHPFAGGRAIGLSAQYRDSGDIPSTDINGNTNGSFSAKAGAYSAAFGQRIGEMISLGLTGKYITSKIDDVEAHALAADVGMMVRPNDHLSLAAVVTNLGQDLQFISQADSLPLAIHGGAAYRFNDHWMTTGEAVYSKSGLASVHGGAEWHPFSALSIRAGYKTNTTKELGATAGVTAGVGIHFMGHEIAYAFVPFGDLGFSQYFSLVLRFSGKDHEHQLARYRMKVAKHDGDYSHDEYDSLEKILATSDHPWLTRRSQ